MDCHAGDEAEAGFDLEKLLKDPTAPADRDRWVRLHDRVAAGEMPPPDYSEVPAKEQKKFVDGTAQWLNTLVSSEQKEQGRVQARRLTNLQLERSLHDLLGIDIPLANGFPEEPRTHGFNTVANGQPMSHYQLEQHLNGVDKALDEAFRRVLEIGNDEFEEDLPAEKFVRTNPKRRCREPEMLYEHAVVWSSNMTFYGRIPRTTAKDDGWYRFTVRAKALNVPEDHGVWCTVRRGRAVSSAPLLADIGAFEATSEPQEWTFTAWIPDGEMLEIRPGDTTLKKAYFKGGQVGAGEGEPQGAPGLAMEWIKFSRIHLGPDDETIRKNLFGSFKIKQHKDWRRAEVTGDQKQEEMASLMAEFAERAFRRPTEDDVVQPFTDFAWQTYEETGSLIRGLRAGYRAILCSPRFLYFQEQPGQLDDYAIASRLSYFLWNRMPDEELLQLAAQGKLKEESTLKNQVRRMLQVPEGRRFVADFTEQWLDLSEIDFTEPDRRMFPKFDIVVQQAMIDECLTFVQTVLDDNMSVTNFIDSDFSFMNERLARFYGIDGVKGDELQRVSFSPESPRGGLLGQGAIQKITANGTNTSPVIRGVWISERLLGQEIAPPPQNVPAIEPDIRGANTIREKLEKHKSNDSCASCHRHIDPPGYALENFDPAGQWRTKYPAPRGKKGLPIDPSYTTADGEDFAGINQFRAIVLKRPEKIARNVVEHMLTYGTGAPISFADREVVEQIVERSADKNYGFRTLIEEAVSSQIFLTK